MPVSQAPRAMRMSELVAASGVSKETIHFYLREGLLPRPKKTRRNMAYYDDEHLERLKLIRRLQTEKYLPLEVIKRVLRPTKSGGPRGGGEDLELLSGLFHLTGVGGEAQLTRAELKRRSGLSAEDVERAERRGLIREQGGRFGADDLRALELVRAVEETGVPAALAIESFALCARHLTALARDEARLFFDWIRHAERPMELVEAMRRAREPQARFVAAMRGRSLKEQIADYVAQIERAVEETGGPSSFPPSDDLLRRSTVLAALQRADPPDPERACFALFALGRFPALAEAAARAIAERGRRPRLVAYAGAAAVEAGDLDGGIALLAEAAEAAGTPPIARALLGAARVRLGRRTIEESGPGSALKQVAAGLDDLGRLVRARPPAGDDLAYGEHLRALLASGRVRTSLPPFFETRADGIADLRAVLASLSSEASAVPPGGGLDGSGARAPLDPAIAATLEANAAWFLAAALPPDDPERPSLTARAAAADPAGPIASRLRRSHD